MIERTFPGLEHIPKGFTGIAVLQNAKVWYKNGERHRTDGPASIGYDGTKCWYQNGRFHREDGPAIIQANGAESWWKHGNLHREDGPATTDEFRTKAWWVNGKRHRIDGPAIEHALIKRKSWWLHNKCIFVVELEDYILIQDGLPCDIEWITPVTQCKVLTDKGIVYIPNLPGIS